MNEYEKLACAIKNKSRKNEWCYRLVAVFLGYAIAFAGGNFFRFNFEVVVLFIGLMFGTMRVSKSLLRNMFLLEGAWNLLIDKGFDVASIIGKPYKTARLGKRMAFLGTLLGAFSGVVTVVDSSGSRNMYSENFENVVFVGTVIFFTFWIPQLVLLN